MKAVFVFLSFLCFFNIYKISAQTHIDSLLLRLQQTNKERQKILILDTLADKTRETNAAESLRYSREQLALAEKVGDTEGVHKAYYNLAYSIDSEGKADSSLYFSQKAYTYFLKQKNYTYAIKSAYNSAYELGNLGRQNEAVPIALANAAYADSVKDASLIGLTSAALGSLYGQIERPTDALPWFEKAFKVFESLNDKAKTAGVYFGQAASYRQLDKDSLAIITMEKALELFRAEHLTIKEVYALNALGELYAEIEQYEKSISYYEKAIDLCKKVQIDNLLFVIYSHCAYSYIRLKRYDKAEKLLKICMPLVEKMQTFEQVRFYETLSGLYSDQGNYQEAMVYMKIVRKLEMKKNEEINNQTDALIKKHAVEKQEQENSLLQARNRFYIGGLMAMLILLGFAAWAYSRLRKQKSIIEQQNESLALLNTTKDKLFSIIAHDLRTPIGTLKTYLEMTDFGLLSQAQFSTASQKLTNNVNALFQTLDNLLQWAYSQLKGIKTQPETINLYEVVSEELQFLYETAQQKNVAIINNIEPETTAFADKNQVGLVIRNTVSNALKFTNSGGEIVLQSFDTEGDKIEIKISDNGIGIPQDIQNQLFTINEKTSRRGTAQEKGQGLGLILAKEMMEANEGSLKIVSVENKGTTVYLELPIS